MTLYYRIEYNNNNITPQRLQPRHAENKNQVNNAK